jgi:CBS domain-containing protein
MTTQPHVCHPDDDVEEALNVMEEYQVRRMPVVDVTDRLVGIISFSR